MKTLKYLFVVPAVAALLLSGIASVRADGAKGGASGLMAPRPPVTTTTGQSAEMKCPRCQYKSYTYTERERAQVRERTGFRMDCPGCKTRFVTVGHGKASQQVAQHTCGNCGAHAKDCCEVATR